MASPRDLYQDIILEHARHPRHYGVMAAATHRAKGHNAKCGDEVEVFLQVEGDTIRAIQFAGQGCAISQASASLMAEALVGQPVSRVAELQTAVTAAMNPEAPEPPAERLGDLMALTGIRAFPARHQCADLAWEACMRALEC